MTTCPSLQPAAPRASLLGDQRGQIAAVAVMSAAAFACLLLLVVNTGSATGRKIELQNAADATAISSATWVARGLNVVSMNNVTQTQILAIVLVIRALDDALPNAINALRVQLALCLASTVAAPVCAPIIEVQIYTLEVMRSAVQSIGRPLARANGPLWRAMLALERVSDGVVNGFLVAAAAEGDRIARQNGADLGLVVPAALRLTLPLRKSAMRPDLCDPTRQGSPSRNSRGYAPLLGYDVDQGPFERYSQELAKGFVLVENSLIRVFFALARESHYLSLCGGSNIASTASESNPDPYILSADADNDLRYLAVVYRSDDERAAPALFRSPLGTHRLAYAQAGVYNPTSFDTFTQDWRARLEPASLIEDGSLTEALGSPRFDDMLPNNGQALTRFRESAGLFAELRRHANVIANFNNH